MNRLTKRSTELSGWRKRLHEIIFEADTFGGKLFDVLLLIAIFLSVLVVMLDSVNSIHAEHADALLSAEWIFTILFTIEYVLRLVCTRRPIKYVLSFYGVVDLLSIVPTYLPLLPQAGATPQLLIIRVLRLLRVFRIFKLGQFLREATALRQALKASRAKITVFLATVLVIVTLMGAAMHLVEGEYSVDGEPSKFTSIPESMYWAIVTMTTVGYGDVVPYSALGKVFASMIMILGYGLIAVPTGIVSVEIAHAARLSTSTRTCPSCSKEGHDLDARCCRFCGERL